MPCNCPAYKFPHRAGGGKCLVGTGVNVCSECGNECDVVTVDEGVGSFDFWGEKGIDEKLVEVSSCCEAEVIRD